MKPIMYTISALVAMLILWSPIHATLDKSGTSDTPRSPISVNLDEQEPDFIAPDDPRAPIEASVEDIEFLHLNERILGIHDFDFQFVSAKKGQFIVESTENGMHAHAIQRGKNQLEFTEIQGSLTVVNDQHFKVKGFINTNVLECCGARKVYGEFEFKQHSGRPYYRLQNPSRHFVCSDENICSYYIDIYI